MKYLQTLITFSIVFGCTTGVAEEQPGLDRNAKLIWETDQPRCYEKSQTLDGKLKGIPRFSVDSGMTEPIRIKGEKPSIEELEGTGEQPAILIMELVINSLGETEAVISLRGGHPNTEQLVATYFANWTWEPTKSSGKPMCIRFVLTHRIHYR